MMMKRILTIFLNPFLLSLWVTLLIAGLFPVQNDKYKSELINSGINLIKTLNYYDDLNNDGNSEMISAFHNSLGTAGLTVGNLNGVLDQWTFKGTLDFIIRRGIIMTGDGNHDGVKEIYLFTLYNDTVFLHMIPDYRDKETVPLNRSVARVGKKNNKMDPYMITGEMQDLNNDGTLELVFGIGTGYSLVPRSIFAYDAVHDTLYHSEESGYFINEILQADINDDGFKEIIPVGYAASNVHTNIDWPDSCSWLMVLNSKLKFEFDPIPFQGEFSKLIPMVMRDNLKRVVFIGLYSLPEHLGDYNILIRFDPMGRIVKQVKVPHSVQQIRMIPENKEEDRMIMLRDGEGFDIYDADLNRRKFIPVDVQGNFHAFDVDRDGSEEIMNIDLLRERLVIYRNRLDHPVVLNIDIEGIEGISFSLKEQKGEPPQLYVESDDNHYLFSYTKNPTYNLRFFIYAAIYSSIVLFTFLVRRIQRAQLQQKEENEKKIVKMQLQLVKNQLDPHFIMNAINSIIASVSKENSDEAREQLLLFSKLHRSLLLSSEKIQQSLEDEIAFTKSYLSLEKFRFRDKFDFTFTIDPEVDLNIDVPKMILQIYVENALKHGILPLENRPGLLAMNISESNNNHLVLEIVDNGVGREFAANNKSESTGKGLLIMEQYLLLYNKYHPGNIHSGINDLYGPTGVACGTKVIIELDYA